VKLALRRMVGSQSTKSEVWAPLLFWGDTQVST
jgi:hypothetical protein